MSVNGESVMCKSYAEVVGMIQKSGPTLNLVVLPKEHDILQQVHNYIQIFGKNDPSCNYFLFFRSVLPIRLIILTPTPDLRLHHQHPNRNRKSPASLIRP